MLWAPSSPWTATPISSVADGTRPQGTFGTSVTPTQNNLAGATYTPLLAGAAVTYDAWEVLLCINSVNIAAAARDAMITLGVDPAGGSAYVDAIAELVCGPAGSYSGAASNGAPVYFRFPYRIAAGSSVAVKASVNSANLTAINVCCELRGQPKRPDATYAGTYVDALGTVPASSRGTLVTPGTASEGAWTQIGTLTRSCRWLEWGYGIDDSTMSNNTLSVDIAIGNASDKRIVVYNAFVLTAGNEAVGKAAQGAYVDGVAGDIVYARSQVGPSAADSNNSVAVYLVGG